MTRWALMAPLIAMSLAACATTGRRDVSSSANSAVSGGPRLHGTDAPYQVAGRWYYPHPQPTYNEVGTASWYGYPFHRRPTATGEIFDQDTPSAAHKTLPLPCIVEVTNLSNGKKARIRVNDRGPFVDGRILDLSRAAAMELGYQRQGTARVRVRYVGPAPPLVASGVRMASVSPPRKSQPAFAPARTEAGDVDFPSPDQSPPEPIPVATAVPPPTLAPVAPSGAYRVQAGAFSSRDNAERAAARLSADAASVQPIQRRGVTLYRVVLGSFPDPQAAAAAQTRATAAGFADAKVIGAE